MKRLLYILSFVFLLAIVTESCSKIQPPTLVGGCEPGVVCGTTSEDPNANPENINDNNSERDITDSEDDEDQDRDVNSE